MKIFWLCILCILLPTTAVAGVFTPPPTDKSVELLGTIFGTNIGSIYLGGGAPNPALKHMFELFNSVVLSIGTVILAYIGLVSTINTAQEGQVMGKKWSSIWIPMRAFLGMALMVPTPASGYSIVQTAVMWVIMQGIGAADHIWNSVLADLGSGLAVSSAIQAPVTSDRNYIKLRMDGEDLTEDLLRSAVCLQTLNRTDQVINKIRAPVKFYSINNPSPELSSDHASVSGTVFVGIKGIENFQAICGQYHIKAEVNASEWPTTRVVAQKELLSKAIEIYEHKKLALNLMFDNLLPLAKEIVEETASPRDDNGRFRVPHSHEFVLPQQGFKDRSIGIYANLMRQMVKPYRNIDVREVVRNGSRSGWISAASFYFSLNYQVNLEPFDNVREAPEAEFVPHCDEEANCSLSLVNEDTVLSPPLRNYLKSRSDKNMLANRLWDAKVYIDHDDVKIAQTLDLRTLRDVYQDAANEAAAKKAGLPMSERKFQQTAVESFAKLLGQKHPDPIIAQGKFGAELMSESEQAWENKIIEADVRINRLKQSGEPVAAEVLDYLKDLLSQGMFALNIYTVVWIMGAVLAIYVPLIPYMMFIVATLGWFLLVIEAIVAAPILAVSFVLPSNDELGKVMQGLMILLNILLRPTLMLFGFILGARLYKVIIQLVNFGMFSNFGSLNTQQSAYAWVALFSVYVGFILALSNKCFGLIYAIPDKVLRWMGGAPEGTDASQELQMAKGGLSKGGDYVNKISSSTAKSKLSELQDRLKQLPGKRNNPPE